MRLQYTSPPFNVERIVTVAPRGDPYRQARQILAFGMVRAHWLWLNAVGCQSDAWALADSLEELIGRGARGGSAWLRDYRPYGTRILCPNHVVFYAEYQRNTHRHVVLESLYLEAEQDPVRQSREILTSGIVSKRCLILYGAFDRTHALVHLLNQAIRTGVCNGRRLRTVGPTALCIHTLNTFLVVARYTRSNRTFTP